MKTKKRLIRTEGECASETSAAKGSAYLKHATFQNRNVNGLQSVPCSSRDAVQASVLYLSKADWKNGLNYKLINVSLQFLINDHNQ